jgi:catechol 2,3-dioxygenase-like lactoylglutathione lyase family enzyme
MEGLSTDLKAQGVEIAQDVIRRWGAQGMGLSIYVKDPDGNTVELKSSTPA